MPMTERILLVDDHPLTRSALAGLLTQHGFDALAKSYASAPQPGLR